MRLQGISASKGIAIAKAYILTEQEFDIKLDYINEVEYECDRYNDALDHVIHELEYEKEMASGGLTSKELQVFDAHIMIATDPDITQKVYSLIKEEKVTVEYAVNNVMNEYIDIFNSMDNNVFKERACDIKDVKKRIINSLLNVNDEDLCHISHEIILIAKDLTPSQTAKLNKDYVKGFVTEFGGETSHSSIMARTMEIPAVVGITNVLDHVRDGDTIVINSNQHEIVINPTKEELNYYNNLIDINKKRSKNLQKLIGCKSVTLDGKEVEIAANIGSSDELENVIKYGADGIGLFRTEFLFMDKTSFPSEEEQYVEYKSVLEKMHDKPVTIRTIDIGGDKELNYLKIPNEMNPFLGLRAIRLSLQKQEMFKTQLKALLRASIYGKLRIMFPMISTLDELLEAKSLLDEVRQDLLYKGYQISSDIEIGMMIEVPSAAVMADIFAKHIDFFSIGTNDLIQYTMAADRMNEHVSYLYQSYNPAILRLVKNVIDAAHTHGKWVGMCGELSGKVKATPLLLGLGLDEFSMTPSSILAVKEVILNTDTTYVTKLGKDVLTRANQKEVLETVENFR